MNVSAKKPGRRMILAGIALLCVAVAVQASDGQPARSPAEPIPLVLVVNRQNAVESLSTLDVRALLLGERTHWPDGRRITVVMREPNQPERDAIIRLVCRMDDREYTRRMLRAVFTGELQSEPKILATASGVLRFIYNVPGAIGYVRASEVDATVKVVRISDPPAAGAFGFTFRPR